MHYAQGSWQDEWFMWPCRVYIEDVDAGGVVYHANHLKYAERARAEMIRDSGVRHSDLMNNPEGGLIVVAGLSVRYLRPLFHEQDLVVASKIMNIRTAGVQMLQEIRTEGQVAATLTVDLVYVANQTRKPARWPDDVFAALAKHCAATP